MSRSSVSVSASRRSTKSSAIFTQLSLSAHAGQRSGVAADLLQARFADLDRLAAGQCLRDELRVIRRGVVELVERAIEVGTLLRVERRDDVAVREIEQQIEREVVEQRSARLPRLR